MYNFWVFKDFSLFLNCVRACLSLWMLGFGFISRETDTHGNSRKSSVDEKCHAPVAMLRLSGSVFVPLTHCHYSHRASCDPLFLSKLLSRAVHCQTLLRFNNIWDITTHQTKIHKNPRTDFQLTALKFFPFLEPINRQKHDWEFCKSSQNLFFLSNWNTMHNVLELLFCLDVFIFKPSADKSSRNMTCRHCILDVTVLTKFNYDFPLRFSMKDLHFNKLIQP